MITVTLRSGKDRPFMPLTWEPRQVADPWSELPEEFREDLQAWDAMFQKGWSPRTGWSTYAEWEGEVYERVAARLHARLREVLDPACYRIADLELPPFRGG
ncbi:hypothetical protein GCM10009702_05910 [Propioniferax innocua]